MGVALSVGLRYLRAKRESTLAMITLVAVGGVTLGVGALLTVLAITSGFQQAFRDKVLGVNAHVLVLKYGVDFTEHGHVVETARSMPEVAGAAPFVIQEMMLAKGERLASVLVKGIDVRQARSVMSVAEQVVEGDFDDMLPAGGEGAGQAGKARPAGRDVDNTLGGDAAKRAGEAFGDSGTPTSPSSTGMRNDVGSLIGALDAPLPDAPPVGLGSDALANGAQGPAAPKRPAQDTASARPLTPEAASLELAALEDEPVLPDDEAEEALLGGLAASSETLSTAAVAALPGVIVGKTLAEELGLAIGDQVRVISPLSSLDSSLWGEERPVGPRQKYFRVAAIAYAGFQEYDSRLVYAPLAEVQSFFEHGDAATGVEVKLHDPEGARAVARSLEDKLGGTPFHTLDWADLNRNLFTALELQKIMLTLVIATIIVVAAFNVIATLIMVVLNKKREIAILKAMGARRRSLVLIFALQGLFVGLLGTLLGLVIGGSVVFLLDAYPITLDPKVYLVDRLPVVHHWLEYVLTASIALAICLVATLMPSFWAARLPPVEGLRYD